MYNIFKKIFKGYKKGPSVFSIPNEDYDHCAVPIFNSYFATKNKFLYNKNNEHIKFYRNRTFEIDNSKIILIGHPCTDTFKGLLSSNSELISSSYFKKSNDEIFEVCFGLICNGFKLFVSPYGWKSIAHEKISFTGEIATEFDVQLPKVHELFARIYNRIYTEIDEYQLGGNLFSKIHNIYNEAFSEINNELSDKDGRAVAILYLSDKIDFLTKT